MSRRLAAIDAETTPSTRIRVTGAFVKVMLMSDRWQYFRCVDRLSHGLEGPDGLFLDKIWAVWKKPVIENR